MWYVYVLKSLKSKYKYIGFTDDLRRRFNEHNSGRGGEYSTRNRPFILIYYEAYIYKRDATSAEIFYKSGNGREILNGKLKFYLNT